MHPKIKIDLWIKIVSWPETTSGDPDNDEYIKIKLYKITKMEIKVFLEL